MIIAILLCQLALCLVIIQKEVIREKFQNFASSIFFLAYTVVYVLEPLVLHTFFEGAHSIDAGMLTLFTDERLYYIVNAYGLTLLLAYLLVGREKPSTQVMGPRSIARDRGLSGSTNYLGALIIVGAFMFIYATGMSLSELIYASRFQWFAESSFSLFWLTVSGYFIALSGLYIYLVRTGPRVNWWLLGLSVGALLLHSFVSKDRKWILFIASGLLAGMYETSGRKLIIRKKAAVSLAVVFVVLAISQFLRDVLARYMVDEDIVMADEIARWTSFLIEYGDISYFYRASIEAVYQNLEHGFLVPFGMLRRLVFMYLPVGYSGGLKVEDISATFSDVVNGGDALRRGNMPPGIFGLFVISFGWIASLFLIPGLAIVLRYLNRMFRNGHGKVRTVVLALYVFAVVLGLRGDDSSASYYIVWSIIVLAGINMFAPRQLVKPSLATDSAGLPPKAGELDSSRAGQ